MSAPPIPGTLYVLFENGAFLGTFTNFAAANRTRKARRRGDESRALDIAEYHCVGAVCDDAYDFDGMEGTNSYWWVGFIAGIVFGMAATAAVSFACLAG